MLEDIKKYISRKEIVGIYDGWDINLELPLADQLDVLHEDILQISFVRNYMIDIGWYPEHLANGGFKGVLIQNQKWDSPIYEIKTTDVYVLIDWLIEIIELVLDFDLKKN